VVAPALAIALRGISRDAILGAMKSPSLSRETLHILIALADRDRHGYSIMQEVRARTGGEVVLSASTLYGAVRRLLEAGLITELAERPDPAHDDERRRYYRLTEEGRRVAVDEVQHLERLLANARATGLVRDPR
jgi:DNA-binding PadR family transcriptional regulator